MAKRDDERLIDAIAQERIREIERRCFRKFGTCTRVTKEQVLEVLAEILLQQLQRYAAGVSRLADQAARTARQVESLNRVVARTTQKGKPRRGKR